MDQNKMGEYIEKLRKAKGMTQKELAEKLGLSNTAVSKWECGCNLPDISMLEPLSKVLEVDIMDLITCKDKESKEENTSYSEPIQENISDNKTVKIHKTTLVLLIIGLISSLLVMPLYSYAFKPKKESSDPNNETKVYEITSKDDRFTIKGYVILNDNQNKIHINKISYQGLGRGTLNEIYVKNIIVKININKKNVFEYVTNYNKGKIYNLGEILSEIKVDNDDTYNTELKLEDINSESSASTLLIEYYDRDDNIEYIEAELELKEGFR